MLMQYQSAAAATAASLSPSISSCHSLDSSSSSSSSVAMAGTGTTTTQQQSSASSCTSSSSSNSSSTTNSASIKDTTFTKIFVGGLPYHTTDASLRQHFHVYGEIDEAVVITDRQTGKSRGYGFVSFSNQFHFFLNLKF